MNDNDLLNTAARVHDELLGIARMFADAEHYKAAIQTQGFARLVIDAAEAIRQETQIKQLQKVKLAS
ncbi:hypothetical protein [Lacipirellula parvula]|uniref:Uncharacterized protein n=1 Tax=Lacipirellula parvula TaxID=2650471 RepID=A0A5K7XQ59_9BACT|nr:hypothetical protein [Lacipirellula parvula]BBO35679.1 hypothetical protein PLANPX_5291 [Lacipirellula parvula]